MAEHDDLTVTYGVKELLAGIRNDVATGFAKLEGALSTKADKVDVARINGRLDEHQKQIEALRQKQDADDAARNAAQEVRRTNTEWRRWLYPTLISLALVLVGLLQAGVFS